MTSTLSLYDFLDQIGTRPHFFSLGRRLTEIPRERFIAFEDADEPWSQPFQQAAWLAIQFHDTKTDEPHLWFLRFPLDEQGLLTPSARDDFLRRIIERASQPETSDEQDADTENPLDDNPFGFKPNEAQMANLHASIAHTLGQAASPHYAHALEYFSGEQGFDQWQFVGLQGIADVAVRHAEHSAMLAAAIPQLPAEPFNVLCSCLENEVIDATLSDAIGQYLRTELAAESPDPVRVGAALRGLSNGSARESVIASVAEVLASPLASHPEILAAIAGRGWECLYDTELRHHFLLCLAQSGQRAFDSILADLLYLPVLRNLLLADIRNQQQPAEVHQAVAAFVQRFTQNMADKNP